MKYIVLFEDDPNAAPDIRTKHMAAHLDFLVANAGAIEAAGPLSDPAGAGRDGLWVVEADQIEEIDRLVHADPFWPTGLRKSYAILKWRQVYAQGTRLIG